MNRNLKLIANHYGLDTQSNQLIEECAELIQAINKYRRAKSEGRWEQEALSNLVEEIADVESMIEQIKYLLGLPDDVIDKIKDIKASNLCEKIRSNENDKFILNIFRKID